MKIYKNVTLNLILKRLKRSFYSFGFKESIFERIIYFYFSFFNRFKTSELVKIIIKFFINFTRFKDFDLVKLQDKRLILINDFENTYKFKQNVLKNFIPKCQIELDLKIKGYANISSMFQIDNESFFNEVKNLKYFNSQVPLQSDCIEKIPDNNSNYFSLRPDLKNINFFFKNFLNNKKLKNIVENYLDGQSYLYSLNTMLTKPTTKKHSVTDLHRDYDDQHFLVLFIYWTDTNKNDGSTFFIPGSHLRENKNLNDGIFLEGAAGSVFLIDTFGWHAGNKNLKKDRLVSWLRFSKNQLNIASFDNKEYLFFDYYNSLWN